MENYQYSPLVNSIMEIRLVTILPGRFKDPIRLELKCTTLQRPIPKAPQRMSLRDIRRTLPVGWTAFEVGCRIIFSKYDGNNMATSWTHPDVTVNRELYDPQDPNIEFEALSYTWGNNEAYSTAIIENCTPVGADPPLSGTISTAKQQKLPLSRNLTEAIKHLRYKHDERVMWIDAICINQADTNEKQHQVPLMGRIYTLARRVVAWLGPEFPNTKLAFRKLDYLGRQLEYVKGHFMPLPDAKEPELYSKAKELPFDDDVWTALLELYSLDWFQRLWVLQEIQLGAPSTVLLCGKQQILWSIFKRASRRIHYTLVGKLRDAKHLMTLIAEMCDPLQEQTFEGILRMQHRRACSDHKDRIYGIMNLAPDTIAEAIQYVCPSRQHTLKNLFLCFISAQCVVLINALESTTLKVLRRCTSKLPYYW